MEAYEEKFLSHKLIQGSNLSKSQEKIRTKTEENLNLNSQSKAPFHYYARTLPTIFITIFLKYTWRIS